MCVQGMDVHDGGVQKQYSSLAVKKRDIWCPLRKKKKFFLLYVDESFSADYNKVSDSQF